ncbi:MAG TPA: dihydrofolate reductase family protein, partial [Acidimicrobiales bacterium]|nr:dihydrofolate reductase family protein [Acidimicrobiales bacterium]
AGWLVPWGDDIVLLADSPVVLEPALRDLAAIGIDDVAAHVLADDPALTVRLVDGPDPLRVVLGAVPPDARVRPALELAGDPGDVLDELGRRDVLQVLVEGGATVAGAFHRAGLVDRYVVYLAPALFGGDDAPGLFSGAGAATMSDVWRGRITHVTSLGDDIRVDLKPQETT